MSAINLVCSTDDNWAPYAAAVILSARDSSPPDEAFVFHILTFGLSFTNIARFKQLSHEIESEIKIHLVDADRVSCFPETPLTKNAYLRIFIGDILSDLKKVLYIDCDILVRRPLRPLYELDLSGFAGAASLDRVHVYKPSMQPYYSAIGMTNRHAYFNSGVMLINLDEWRMINIPAKVCTWFEANPDVGRFGDQDPLNVILESRIRDLSPRWNMTSSLTEAIHYKGQTGRTFATIWNRPRSSIFLEVASLGTPITQGRSHSNSFNTLLARHGDKARFHGRPGRRISCASAHMRANSYGGSSLALCASPPIRPKPHTTSESHPARLAT